MPKCPRCGSKEVELCKIEEEGHVQNIEGECKWCGKKFFVNPFDPEGEAT